MRGSVKGTPELDFTGMVNMTLEPTGVFQSRFMGNSFGRNEKLNKAGSEREVLWD